MATLQPVTEHEWERHKGVLMDMYCAKKLPLQRRKGKENDPAVIELMKERHGFFASAAQYELQFKKWGFVKNLKSCEWAALISQHDLLCQTKSDVRIIVSGSVISKHKIDRARRRYRPRNNRSRSNRCGDGTLPASRQAHVEFIDESGEWRKYSGAQVNTSNAIVLHKSSRTVEPKASLNDPLSDQDRPKSHEMDTDLDVTDEVGAAGHDPLSHDNNTIYRPLSPLFDLNQFFTNSVDCFGTHNLGQTPASSLSGHGAFLWGLSSGSSILNGPLDFPPFLFESPVGSPSQENTALRICHEGMVLGGPVSVSGTHSQLEGARSIIESLVHHGKMAQCNKRGASTETDMPDVEDIIEILESLLLEVEAPPREISGLSLSLDNAFSTSSLFKTLLYSFTNNLAGLRDVPRKALMQLLREHHDIRTRLFEVIKSGHTNVAKSLADNLFRAAVEGCDADAVATIIHHTKSNAKIAIDLNEIVCKLGHKDITPIELAAKFRNPELVRTLVASRADPNKTYRQEQDNDWEKGALALALGHWENGSKYPFKASPADEPEPVNLHLLRMLLDCGAEVRMDLAENAMRPGSGHTAIAEELVSRIPASDHQSCFRSKWLLVSIVHYLENDAATRLIRRFFADCSSSTDCDDCTPENPRLIERMLCHAARRLNLELSKFLVQHTAQVQSALAAAVRAASEELIQLFMDRGARVDDLVEPWQASAEPKSHYGCVYDGMYDENGYDRPTSLIYDVEYVVTPFRTPLAEAIRTGNEYLIKTFERLGALARLDDEHHFQAAVLAAVEVGNISWLKVLLHYGSSLPKGPILTLPLAVAIRNEETAAALILLDAGAKP